ncbi:MAG: S24/S26 family peptidase [Acidobacteriota bacterium]
MINTKLFTTLTDELLKRGCQIRFQASGNSMHPTIRNGEVITIEPAQICQLRTWDIVFYKGVRGLLAHRLLSFTEVDNGSLILRGDACSDCDEPVTPAQILGRVIAVERSNGSIRLSTKLAKMHYCWRVYIISPSVRVLHTFTNLVKRWRVLIGR